MIERIQSELLNWFEINQRDLPWRLNKDPYRIWVSEIMLQQTRVDTVIPYYENFMTQFPTLNELADADEEKVIKAWEGLGYYSRVRNLHSAVKEVASSYGGVVPDSQEEISTLKGVGPYTAGAILSIAYGKRIPAVDGNVMRVISRIYNLHDDIAKVSTRKNIETIVTDLIPDGSASYFNQALMELGALICVPRSPKCLSCPLQHICKAREAGVEENLPIKTRAKKPRPVQVTVGVIEKEGKVLIHKRPTEGLLGGLWEFLGGEVVEDFSSEDSLIHILYNQYRIKAEIQSFFMPVQHTFSHLIWNMRVFRCKWIEDEELPPFEQMKWVALHELKHYAFPVAHLKIVNELIHNDEREGCV